MTETVAQIMDRQRATAPSKTPLDMEGVRAETAGRKGLPQNPLSPAVASFPLDTAKSAVGGPNAPQTPSTQLTGSTFEEIQAWPPDSSGAVGTTQYLAGANFHLKTFNKTTGAPDGALNVNANVFFNSVRGATNTTDPRIRFDPITKRWFITYINTTSANNLVLLAVSSGSTITNSSSFTFFSFQHDLVSPVGDSGCFADYETLGIDVNALYIGVNDFCPQTYISSTGFVVRKSSVLGAGPIVVTAFRNLAMNGFVGGMFTPQGVDNPDPSATEGYFIAVTFNKFGELTMRRISNPGGTPSISPNIAIVVPTTADPILVPHKNPGGANNNPLDALDDRLFMASMRNGHIWTTHNIQVNASGVASASGGRNGSRWYDIAITPTTAALNQAGTVFDPAASQPNSYWIPSLAVSGQGHMALGSSVAGAALAPNAAATGRLATDPLGTTQTPAHYTNDNFAYNPSNLGASVNRWGDYSQTSVDPEDDMTMWTIQEWAYKANSYATRAVKLLAPPPATPSSVSPATVPAGQSSVNVVVTGTSASGSGFFDPGAGFTKHIAGSISGGVTVNSATYTSPTSVTLNISTAGATAGAKDVTITNPDGQTSTGTGVLSVGASNGPSATLTPSSWPFGSQNVGSSSAAKTFTLTSDGASAVSVGAVSFTGGNTGDFVLDTNGCTGQVLAPSATCTVNVKFAPTVAGARSTTLSIASDGTNAPHTSALSGTGLVPDSTPPSQVTGLAGSPGDGSASLSWNAATDNVGVDHYVVYQNGVDVAHPTGTSITITGLTNGVVYPYSVRAVDAAGNEGLLSSTVNVTPQALADFYPGWSQFHANQARTGYAGGNGDIPSPAFKESVVGSGKAASPLVVDLDNDGGSDLVATFAQTSPDGAATTIKAFRQVLGTLQNYWTYTFTSTQTGITNSWANAAVADLDNDGTPEVVGYFGSQRDAQVATSTLVDGQIVVLNGQTGAVKASMSPTDLAVGIDTPPAIGDVNNDNIPDILVTRVTGGTGAAAGGYLLGARLNGASLIKEFDFRLSANTPATGPVIAELRAGHAGKEVVVADDAGTSTMFLCSPTLVAAGCSESVALTTGTRGIAVADLNKDGIPEIVANGRSTNTLNVIKTTPTLSRTSQNVGYLWNTPSLADIDGDGATDIVNVGYSEFIDDTDRFGDVTIRGWNGTTITDKGTLTRHPEVGGNFQSTGGGVMADLDGDGKSELIYGQDDGNVVAIKLIGTGAPKVLWTLAELGGATPTTLAVGDVDGDGFNDIVVADDSGAVRVIGKIGPPNQPPVATNSSSTTAEDTAKLLTLSATDPDGDSLQYVITSLPANGTLKDGTTSIGSAPATLSGNTVTYTPNDDYNGSDAFTFKANDGQADSNSATVSLAVMAVNDAPNASPQPVTTQKDTAKVITLQGTDVDGNSLTFKVSSPVSNGKLYDGTSTAAPQITSYPYGLTSNKVTYAPDAGYVGADAFGFKANDGLVDSSQSTVSITVSSGSTVVVRPSNQGLWQTDNLSDNSGGSASGTFVNGPATPPLGAGSYRQTANSGDKQYLVSPEFNGTSLSGLNLAYSTYSANTGPQRSALNLLVDRNGDGTFDETLVFEPYSQSGTGMPVVAPNVWQTWDASAGKWWTSRLGQSTLFSLAGYVADNPAAKLAINQPAFKIVAGSTGTSWPNYVGSIDRVVVNATSYDFESDNAAPVATSGSATTPEDAAKTVTLQGTDANPGDTLRYIVVSLPTNGSLSDGATAINSVPFTLAGNTVTYTPSAHFNGSDSFTFKLNDGSDDSNVATESLTVTPVNDPPTANAQSFSTAEETSKTLTLTGSDIDNNPLSFRVASLPARGTLKDGVTPITSVPFTLSGASVTYTPAADYNGSDSFTFKSNDGQADSAAVTVSGTVTPVNDAPSASDQSVGTGQNTAKTVTVTGTDVDGDPLSFRIVSLPTHGTLKDGATTIWSAPFTLSGNTVTYTPATGYSGGDSFGFKAFDGLVESSNTGTVTIGVNDVTPPDTTITSGPPAVTSNRDATLAFTSTESGTFQCKLDGAAYAACTSPVSFTNLADGSHTFSVRAIDGSGNLDPTPATRTWTIDATPPDTVFTSGPTGTVSGTNFTFAFQATEAGSTFQCSLDGAGFTSCVSPKNVAIATEGVHTFSVKATDSVGNTDPTSATRTWTIDNTAPSVPSITTPTNGSTLSDSVVTITGSGVVGSTIKVYEGLAVKSTATVNGAGNWSTIVGLANGVHNLTASATDGAGNESAKSAVTSITVADTEAPSAPVITSPASGSVVPSGQQTIAGSGTPGTIVRAYEGSTLLGSATLNATSWSLLASLLDGNHTVKATATDPAGNTSPFSTTVTFRVGQPDSAAPTVSINSSNPIAQTTITGSAHDNVSGVASISVTFSQVGFAPVVRTATCSLCRPGALNVSWSVSVAGLTPGFYTVTAAATDVAGNTGTSPAAQFMIIPN